MNRSKYLCLPVVLTAALALVGCGGSKTSEVKGVVTLDGKPVEGAMVLFTSDDGSISSGMTDASGNFELVSGPSNTKGAPPGVYRVSITKVKTMEGMKGPNEGGADGGGGAAMMKNMEKMAKESAKASGTGGKGGGPPGMNVGKASGGSNSLLPQVYATPQTTPFTGIKVPADGPIKLDMSSSGGGGPPGAGGPPGSR